jgi:hypothetical protein
MRLVPAYATPDLAELTESRATSSSRANLHGSLESLEGLEIERTSGVFRVARKRDKKSAAPSTEDIARAVQAITRTWVAVLFVPGFRAGGRASVVPAPARADDSGFSLVMRLGAWLPQAGEATCALDVPAYVRRWMPVDRALAVPIQTLHTVGWIAVPFIGSTRDQVRRIEAIASGVALELDRADRSERIAALAGL